MQHLDFHVELGDQVAELLLKGLLVAFLHALHGRDQRLQVLHESSDLGEVVLVLLLDFDVFLVEDVVVHTIEVDGVSFLLEDV